MSNSQQPGDLGPQRTQQMSCCPSGPPKFWTQPQFPSPLLLTAGIPLQLYSSSPPQQPLSELEHSGTADSCTWSPPMHCCLGNRERWEPAAGLGMFQ